MLLSRHLFGGVETAAEPPVQVGEMNGGHPGSPVPLSKRLLLLQILQGVQAREALNAAPLTHAKPHTPYPPRRLPSSRGVSMENSVK